MQSENQEVTTSQDQPEQAWAHSGEHPVSFEELGLSGPVVASAIKNGWTKPTPVQALCLPKTINGKDVAGFAQTGTGKTGVFVLTIAERLTRRGPLPSDTHSKKVAYPDVLVLTPTRELAIQIDEDAKKILQPLNISSMAVFGGVDLEKQAAALKANPQVIVATPGRLKDFFQRKLIDLSKVSILICDEADRMFDMGFISEVEYFLDQIPEESQKLLFSATTNDDVKELAFEYLNHPDYVSVNPETITAENIEQHAVICDTSNKLRVILGLIRDHKPECALIFTNTKMTAEWLHFKLAGNGLDVDIITGDLPQRKRIQLIHRIKEGKVKVLIATDVASRGLHISKLTHVYNFDVPEDAANYVHRIGRTARAGAHGSSYTLVCEDYGEHILPIQQLLGEKIPLKGEWYDPGYLSIEDLAGNPYAVGAALYRDPKDRLAKKGGAKETRDRFEKKSFDGKTNKKNPKTESKEPFNRSSTSSERSTLANKKFESKKTHAPHKNAGPSKGSSEIMTYRAEGTPLGLFGWIAKIFKALLGRKL